MFKGLVIGSILSMGLLGADAVMAGGITVDIGGGGHRISCWQGTRIVRNAGFWRVRAIECQGREYTYRGLRHHRMFAITVKSRNGRIVDVRRLGRGGGYGGGGYGDDYDDYDDDY